MQVVEKLSTNGSSILNQRADKHDPTLSARLFWAAVANKLNNEGLTSFGFAVVNHFFKCQRSSKGDAHCAIQVWLKNASLLSGKVSPAGKIDQALWWNMTSFFSLFFWINSGINELCCCCCLPCKACKKKKDDLVLFHSKVYSWMETVVKYISCVSNFLVFLAVSLEWVVVLRTIWIVLL